VEVVVHLVTENLVVLVDIQKPSLMFNQFHLFR
jgi:hypothetical protein